MRLGGHPRVNVDREEAGQKTEPWGIPTLRDGKRWKGEPARETEQQPLSWEEN